MSVVAKDKAARGLSSDLDPSFARSFTRMGVRDQLEVNSGRLYPYTAEDLARHGRALLRGRLPAEDSRPRALTEATPPARPTPLLKRATSDVF